MCVFFRGLLGGTNTKFCNLSFFNRWEKYQSEEEEALGWGKQLRKEISYKESFNPHATEVSTEVTMIYDDV